MPSAKVKGIDLLGMTFGFWTVLEFMGRDPQRNLKWRCRCVCGREKVVAGQHLRYGSSKSCGCKTAGLRGVKAERHYSWKGGGHNRGSLAWCNARLDSLRQGQRRNGGAEIASSAGDVLRLWLESDGHCVACKREPSSTKDFHLDHDRVTGAVRGFLCGKCNVAIGMAGDSPSRLRQLADYLESCNRITP